MRRTYTINRWNWSEKAKKWVYVEMKGRKRHYTYNLEPPKEFMDLTQELNKINKKLMVTEDPDQNKELFLELMEISKRMQNMGKGGF